MDGGEMVDLGWHTPAGALEAGRSAARSTLVFPTIKHLEQLAGFDTADALLAWTEGREIVPVEPRVDSAGRIVLPHGPA